MPPNIREQIENVLLEYAHDVITFQQATEALLRIFEKFGNQHSQEQAK